MSRSFASLRSHLTGLDAWLLLAGVLGLVVYFHYLPSQHPDSAAASSLTHEEVGTQARAFVQEYGFVTPANLEQEVDLARNAELLDSLQGDLGRAATVALLHGEARSQVPAYYWAVTWTREEGSDQMLGASLTLDGQLFAFQSDPSQMPVRRVEREALAYVLQAPPLEEGGAPRLDAPDSTLAEVLSFDLADAAGLDLNAAATTEEVAVGMTTAEVPAALQAGQQVRLNARAAAALARYHLARTAWRDAAFYVDSVRVEPRPGLDAVAVYLHSEAPLYEQEVQMAVEVAASGALLNLAPTFNPQQEAEVQVVQVAGSDDEAEGEGNLSFSITTGGVADLLMGGLYVLLVLVTIVLFGRRLNARLVDARSALRDAVWGGLFVAGLVLVSAARPLLDSIDQIWLALVLLSVNVSLAGAGGAFLIFLASGAMDSVGRSAWADKLTTLSLVRHSVLFNVPVGAALLRGLLVAFLLLGGTTALLVGMPGAAIHFSEGGPFAHEVLLTVAGYAFAKDAWLSQFISLTVMLGVGTLLYRWKPRAWVVVPGIALVLLLMQVPFLDLVPLSAFALLSGCVGLVLAVTFWRYDFITCFTAYLFYGLLWETQDGWLIDASPQWIDALLAFATAGLVGVLGLVGLWSRKTATEVPSFVPAYIQEMAQEERLKREVEIAYQVQASFLPRRMPRVEGLDVAGMCLPALDVGGDYFDFVELPDRRLAVAVGDVSGKGIQAAFYMTLTKGFLQTLCRSVASPAEVLRRLNGLFCENVPRGTFISMIYGVLDVEARTFTFARAGHNPVILKRSPSQDPELFKPAGIAIGLVAGAPFDDTIREVTLHLRPGDVLVFYTDGFSEAMNLRKEMYGDQRLADRVSEVGQRTANEILRAVSEDVHHFVEAAGRHDDMTMVVIKMDGRAAFVPGKSVKVEQVARV